MDCIYRRRVRVVLGISLWLHCVQEGWGHPSLKRPSWIGWVLAGPGMRARAGSPQSNPVLGESGGLVCRPPWGLRGVLQPGRAAPDLIHIPRWSKLLGMAPSLHCGQLLAHSLPREMELAGLGLGLRYLPTPHNR